MVLKGLEEGKEQDRERTIESGGISSSQEHFAGELLSMTEGGEVGGEEARPVVKDVTLWV